MQELASREREKGGLQSTKEETGARRKRRESEKQTAATWARGNRRIAIVQSIRRRLFCRKRDAKDGGGDIAWEDMIGWIQQSIYLFSYLDQLGTTRNYEVCNPSPR